MRIIPVTVNKLIVLLFRMTRRGTHIVHRGRRKNRQSGSGGAWKFGVTLQRYYDDTRLLKFEHKMSDPNSNSKKSNQRMSTSYYSSNWRNGNALLITMFAPDVTRSSCLSLCLCPPVATSPFSLSPRLAFQRASSSSVVASFNNWWCSVL